jgi:hypothetical protein
VTSTADVLPGVLPELENPADVERRRQVKKGQKTMEALRETFVELGADGDPNIVQLLAQLDQHLERLKPPEPRKCKEYLRALSRAKKGLLGIAPEHVVLYCRCFECTSLRAKEGLEQPATRPVSPVLMEPEAEADEPAAETATA